MNFEEAKQKLTSSGKAGRLVCIGNDQWSVEPLPERAKALEDAKKAREVLKLHKEQEAERVQKERMMSREKGMLLLEEKRQKEAQQRQREQEYLLSQQYESNRHWRQIETTVFEDFEKASENTERIRLARDQVIRSSLGSKYGTDAQILMQYRHSGSDSERGNEWGLWFVCKQGSYFAYHESRDRATYAGKKNEISFESRQEAINYAAWHTGKDWYSDEKFILSGTENKDFPRKNPPSSEERLEAIKRFKRWKDIASDDENIFA